MQKEDGYLQDTNGEEMRDYGSLSKQTNCESHEEMIARGE